MNRFIFTGQKELFEATQRVGMVIGACARLEQAVAYLEWQLFAFSWDKENPQASEYDRQTALRSEREARNRYAPLNQRLKATSKAFSTPIISERISREVGLKLLRRRWAGLRQRAETFGEKRNMLGHTYLCWSDGKVWREIGRPWNEKIPVSEEEDKALNDSIHELAHEIGRYATELGSLLPFADHDLVIA